MRSVSKPRWAKLSIMRLYLVIFLLMTLILLGTVWYFYRLFTSVSLENAKLTKENRIMEVQLNVRRTLNQLEETIQPLAFDESMIGFATSSEAKRFADMGFPRMVLNNALSRNGALSQIVLYLSDGHRFSAFSNSDGVVRLAQYKACQRVFADRFAGGIPSKAQYTGCYRIDGRVYFAYIVPISRVTGSVRLGAFVALCDAEALMRLCVPDELGYALVEGGQCLLAANGMPTDIALLSDGVHVQGGTRYYLSRIAQDGFAASVVLAYSEGQLLPEDMHRIRNWGVIMALAVLLTQGCMALLINQRILHPIRDIAQQTEAVEAFRDNVRRPDGGQNEVVQLSNGINRMLERLSKVTEEKMERERLYYRMLVGRTGEKVMYLQARINPHFLYNNLECLRGMNAMGNDGAMREMIGCMAALYRYCVDAKGLVTLREELDCVRLYIRIIALRYPGRYELVVDVPDEFGDRLLPRMTLQPILENSILHGFKGRDHGRLRIAANALNGGECLSISDDGVGIDPRALTELNARLGDAVDLESAVDADNKIGIFNVNARVQLLLGPMHRLRLSLGEGGGVVVTLLLVGSEGACMNL